MAIRYFPSPDCCFSADGWGGTLGCPGRYQETEIDFIADKIRDDRGVRHVRKSEPNGIPRLRIACELKSATSALMAFQRQ